VTLLLLSPALAALAAASAAMVAAAAVVSFAQAGERSPDSSCLSGLVASSRSAGGEWPESGCVQEVVSTGCSLERGRGCRGPPGEPAAARGSCCCVEVRCQDRGLSLLLGKLVGDAFSWSGANASDFPPSRVDGARPSGAGLPGDADAADVADGRERESGERTRG